MIQVTHTRVFAASPTGGNPCPVIEGDHRLSDARMQELARTFGLDTAIILPPQSKRADLRIRYFVPDHEMGVSGHATIAAITVAFQKSRMAGSRIRVETITGIFEVHWQRGAAALIVTLEQNAPVYGATLTAGEIARALNIDTKLIESDRSPIQSVSVSRPKLLIPVRDAQVLNRIRPDYEELWRCCETFGVSGFYPFTRRTDKPGATVEARQFPLRAGFPEDAATGVAAAALAAYLTRYDLESASGHQEFRIAQGYAMGAPSLIEALADADGGNVVRTAIRGSARVVSRERLPV